MAKKRSLGRGFDALIPKDLDRSILEEDKSRVQRLLISDIIPNPDQPRREHPPEALNELTSSIKHHGILQPIIVIRHKNGYRIVAGERRWQAAKAAGLKHMPAIVRSLEELEQVELALIENIQRVDLSPLEQALAVYKLQQQFNLSLDDIARKLGKAISTVSNLTRLLQLPETAMEALRAGKISEGHARCILSLRDWPDHQKQLLNSILNNDLSVRQAEQFVNRIKSNLSGSKNVDSDPNLSILSSELSQQLDTKVKIQPMKSGGRLIIQYKSEKHLQELAKLFTTSDN